MKQFIQHLEQKFVEGSNAFFSNILLCSVTMTFIALILLQSVQLAKKYVLRVTIFLTLMNLLFLHQVSRVDTSLEQNNKISSVELFKQPVTPLMGVDINLPMLTQQPEQQQPTIEEIQSPAEISQTQSSNSSVQDQISGKLTFKDRRSFVFE